MRLSVPAFDKFMAGVLLFVGVSTGCTADKDGGGGGGGSDDSAAAEPVDLDEDGYGSPADCDDGSSAISPGADELCNSIDDDCDGLVDEEGASDGQTWHPDADGDGYGDSNSAVLACEQPVGMTGDASDCDDSAAAALPGGVEVCDGLDNDCDGETDEDGASDGLQAHPDADGDSYGDPATSALVCALEEGMVIDGTDCDDDDALVHPSATEVCDDLDNDCDDEVDEDASDLSTWYLDADRDSYGVAESTVDSCDRPSGYAARDGDCDDSSTRANPGETEVCDGIDNNCDDVVDTDAVDMGTYYYDGDDDGYGDDDLSETVCDADEGYVATNGDCDDDDASVHPRAGDEEDGIDNDCDGLIDEGGSGSYDSFEGTFSYIITVDDAELCVVYWDTSGSAIDTCDDCLWAFNLTETYSTTDGDCGEGSDFDWPWGLVAESSFYSYPYVVYYFEDYGWYPQAYADWDETTGEISWALYQYYDYGSYYIYYTLLQEGYAG